MRCLTDTKLPKFMPDTGRLYLMTSREFARSKVSFPSFLLASLLQPDHTSSEESLPRPIQALLKEFQDTMPDSLLDGLPPMRGIEHHINLISGASLPNRAAYRASPTKCQEYQRQVEEVLTKGFIRDHLSLALCR